ncbi:MAG: flagellar basal body rod protein FlgC [Nitrospira sp.]
MISAIHTALTGLTAFGKHLEVVAHNIANVNTDGFKKFRTTFVEAPTSGVLPVIDKDSSSGPTVLRDTGYTPIAVELSNTDLGEELVQELLAQRSFEANLHTIQTGDALLGSLLDLKK